MKLLSQRAVCTSVFIGALFTVTKVWIQPEHPQQIMGKEDVFCAYKNTGIPVQALGRKS